MFRTHTCGDLTLADNGKRVTLTGWIHRVRDHGGVFFVDLRDRYGVTQVVFNPEIDAASHETAQKLKPEYVLKIVGIVDKQICR